jgi:hypothetical protein
LHDPEPLQPGIWAITLGKEGLWIEDGMKPHSLIDSMLKSPKAKSGPNGKYMVVPFTHSDSAMNIGTSNSLTTVLQNLAKKELKKSGIPMKKLERDATGKPLIGLIDSIKQPSKGTQETLGYLEKNKFFYKKTNSPASISSMLNNIKIYQNEVKDKEGNTMMNKHGMAQMSKSAKTFRVISESQKGSGLWEHPGLKKVSFFESALDWAEREWEDRIKPRPHSANNKNVIICLFNSGSEILSAILAFVVDNTSIKSSAEKRSCVKTESNSKLSS